MPSWSQGLAVHGPELSTGRHGTGTIYRMSDAVAEPPDGSDKNSGIRHYTSIIATDDTARRDAVSGLMGWLVRPGTRAAANDGLLYWVWASLDDVADLYGDEPSFHAAAKLAADEWLMLSANDLAAERAWAARWESWLEEYGTAHVPWADRAKATIARLLLEHWDVLDVADTDIRPDREYLHEAQTMLSLMAMGADADEVAAHLAKRADELCTGSDPRQHRVAAEALVEWYSAA